MDEMFDDDLVSVLGNRYHDATTDGIASAQPPKQKVEVKPQVKKEAVSECDWESVAEKSFIQKLEAVAKGALVPVATYLVFWAWLQSGMMETVPAVICMSVSMLVLWYNVRRATK